MTLQKGVNDFGANDMRIALAEPGNSMGDVNFLLETADMTIH